MFCENSLYLKTTQEYSLKILYKTKTNPFIQNVRYVHGCWVIYRSIWFEKKTQKHPTFK